MRVAREKVVTIFVVVVVLIIAWGALSNVRRRRTLTARFGAEVADLIMKRRIWQGATQEMIVESIGRPVDIDERVMKTKCRHVFKYAQRGRNKFALRLTFEDGHLVGWDDKR